MGVCKVFSKHCVDSLINCGVHPDDSSELRLRKQTLTLLPIIIGIAATIWGSIYFMLGHYLSASIPLSYALISVLSLFYFSYSKSLHFILTSQLILVILLPFMLMWSLGGFSNGSYVMIWAFYTPLAAMSFSKRSSLRWFIMFLFLTLVSALIDDFLTQTVTPLPALAINIFSLLNITTGFGGIFYIMYHYISEKNNLTDELETLNANLEDKIKSAVLEAQHTHELLIRQSKFASMGEMISMIAHQWRQPLSAISATTGSMQMKIAMDKYEKDYFSSQLDTISSLSQHLSTTIEDFRNFFKPDKQKGSFALKDALKNVLNLSESMILNNHINLEVSYDSNKSIESYENEVVQALINIIKNAIDILVEKKISEPKIAIKLFDDAHDKVVISIEDNAGGIPEDIIDKIFQPYFSTKSKNGTGLGLYMSKIIIEEHCNGTLHVSNSNEGACFTMEFKLSGLDTDE